MFKTLLKELYGLSVNYIEKSRVGAGSDTYFVTCDDGKYVLKYPNESDINHPDTEPQLCAFRLSRGIRVSEFVQNALGKFISVDTNKRKFHLQRFVSGETFDLNAAPEWLLMESAQTLGKIHMVLEGFVPLPEGIGTGFFRFMTPRKALLSYRSSLEKAKSRGDKDIVDDLLYRIELMGRFPDYSFDLGKLSRKNTHGDYFISQLICGDDRINAVIDWTTACIHPIVGKSCAPTSMWHPAA